MRREEKIAEAIRLREEGLSYREIGERLGVSKSCAQRWVKPEWARERGRIDNAKRRAAKFAWESGSCPRCGGHLGDRHRSDQCGNCEREDRRRKARERAERYIQMRSEGLLNREIAERENVSPNIVAVALSKATRYGLTVPPPPYWDRGKERSA